MKNRNTTKFSSFQGDRPFFLFPIRLWWRHSCFPFFSTAILVGLVCIQRHEGHNVINIIRCCTNVPYSILLNYIHLNCTWILMYVCVWINNSAKPNKTSFSPTHENEQKDTIYHENTNFPSSIQWTFHFKL